MILQVAGRFVMDAGLGSLAAGCGLPFAENKLFVASDK
jgi:hypothetical protein